MTSRYPKRFEDDGTNVTVDVHGCSVSDAAYIVRRSVQEASRRGRARVIVIHGMSTESGTERTIKSDLERRLASGEFEAWISGSTQDHVGGRTTLWITIGGGRNSSLIKMSDVVRA